jgi:hypothetical protein
MDKAEEFSLKLKQALRQEARGINPKNRDKMIKELKKTSGLFKGLADTLRAKKPKNTGFICRVKELLGIH